LAPGVVRHFVYDRERYEPARSPSARYGNLEGASGASLPARLRLATAEKAMLDFDRSAEF